MTRPLLGLSAQHASRGRSNRAKGTPGDTLLPLAEKPPARFTPAHCPLHHAAGSEGGKLRAMPWVHRVEPAPWRSSPL